MKNQPSSLILHIFSTFGIGGPQVRFAQLANQWGRKFRHIVIALDGNDTCKELIDVSLDANIKVLDLSGSLLQRISLIRRKIEEISPSLMITYNWGAIEWGLVNWLTRLPHIHVEDGFGPDEKDQRLFRRSLFRRVVLRGANAVIVPSRTLYSIARNEWRINENKLHYIPNGVDMFDNHKISIERYAHHF